MTFKHTMSEAEEAAWVASMKHGATQQAEAPVAQAGYAEPKPAPVATPPGSARWEELTQHELIMLGAIVGIYEEDGEAFDGIDEDRLCRAFAGQGWDDAEFLSTLNVLRREGYAAPYADSGLWAPAGKGIAVIHDWRRRTGR